MLKFIFILQKLMKVQQSLKYCSGIVVKEGSAVCPPPTPSPCPPSCTIRIEALPLICRTQLTHVATMLVLTTRELHTAEGTANRMVEEYNSTGERLISKYHRPKHTHQLLQYDSHLYTYFEETLKFIHTMLQCSMILYLELHRV